MNRAAIRTKALQLFQKSVGWRVSQLLCYSTVVGTGSMSQLVPALKVNKLLDFANESQRES